MIWLKEMSYIWRKGNISYLLSQKPEVQAYNAIFALFDHLFTKGGSQNKL